MSEHRSRWISRARGFSICRPFKTERVSRADRSGGAAFGRLTFRHTAGSQHTRKSRISRPIDGTGLSPSICLHFPMPIPRILPTMPAAELGRIVNMPRHNGSGFIQKSRYLSAKHGSSSYQGLGALRPRQPASPAMRICPGCVLGPPAGRIKPINAPRRRAKEFLPQLRPNDSRRTALSLIPTPKQIGALTVFFCSDEQRRFGCALTVDAADGPIGEKSYSEQSRPKDSVAISRTARR